MSKTELPTKEQALAGRAQAILLDYQHTVLSEAMDLEVTDESIELFLGMGCFWGAERKLWQTEGVLTTAVGYAGGFTKNPSYEEVCSGMTGHSEVVRVVLKKSALATVLAAFWENHDPTQGMKQGNDIGTQYRSAIYVKDASLLPALRQSKAQFESQLNQAGYSSVTTEITTIEQFYFAEQYHQQYLDKNPNGYCGLKGTGVVCAI
jgi:peptide-methionine (S)-S-oxide reductase